jgi:hypothetical protein
VLLTSAAVVVPHAFTGVELPHRWHLSGMFPRNVLRFVPLRPIRSGHGTSAIRPHFGHVALRCV